MAGREGHVLQIGHIPRVYDMPSGIRIASKIVNDPLDLVEGRSVSTAPVDPLFSIDGAQIAVFVGPGIPDVTAIIVQLIDVRITAEKPQHFASQTLEEGSLRRYKRKSLIEIEAHLVPENAPGTGSGSICL